MQKRRTRHGIQASPYGTQHNGHTYGIRTVQRIQDQDTAYGLHTAYTTIHHTPYTRGRVACLADIARMSYTCSAVLPAPTVSTVAPLRGSLACVHVLYALCLYVQPSASQSSNSPHLPCFLAALHPPLLHSLSILPTDMRLSIVDVDCPF